MFVGHRVVADERPLLHWWAKQCSKGVVVRVRRRRQRAEPGQLCMLQLWPGLCGRTLGRRLQAHSANTISQRHGTDGIRPLLHQWALRHGGMPLEWQVKIGELRCHAAERRQLPLGRWPGIKGSTQNVTSARRCSVCWHHSLACVGKYVHDGRVRGFPSFARA